jgi:hypothetical protein
MEAVMGRPKDREPVSAAAQLAVVAPVASLALGVGTIRRGRPAIGWTILAAGATEAVVLACLGSPRPLLGLIAIAAFAFGLELDANGRRALGLLGVSAGMFVLLTAVVYA